MNKKIAITATLSFLGFGIGWILITDSMLDIIFSGSSSDVLFKLQNLKGIFFVIATSIFLYLILKYLVKQIERNEFEYRKLFENHPNPMWIYDPETLNILRVNQAAIDKYGFSKEEFIKLNIKDLRPVSDIPKLENAIKKLENQEFRSGIWKHKKKNGDIFFVSITSNAAHFNNKIARMVLAIDVDEKVKSDQKIIDLNNTLNERESYLRSIIENQNTFILRLDHNGDPIFINSSFIKEFNIEEQQIPFFNIYSTINYTDKELLINIINKCIAKTGEAFKIQLSHKNNQNINYKINWEFKGVYNESKNNLEIQAIGIDTTEKHLLNEKVKIYQDRLDAIINTLNEIVWMVDAESKEVKFLSPAIEEISGYSPEDFYNKKISWKDIVHPDDLNLVANKIYNSKLEEIVEVEYRMIDSKNQTHHIFEKTIKKIDPEGKEIVYGVSTDISNLTKIRAELNQLQLKTQALIDNTRDLVWSIDSKYNLTYANSSFISNSFNVFGKEIKLGDSLIENTISDFTDWKDHYDKGLAGDFFNIQIEIKDSNKLKHYAEISFNPIKDSHNKIIGLGCFWRDITEQVKSIKKTEEQFNRLREIAQIQSHGLRRPVANILGLSEMLNSLNPSDKDIPQIITHMGESAKELDEIINLIVNKANEIKRIN